MEVQVVVNAIEFLECGVCLDVATDAMECAACKNIFCQSCLNRWKSTTCPSCRKDSRIKKFKPATFARLLIIEMKGDCPGKCGTRMRQREFTFHKSRCPKKAFKKNNGVDDVMVLKDLTLDPEVLDYYLSCPVCSTFASEPVQCETCHKVSCKKCFTEMPLKRCPGCNARAVHYPAHLARRMIGEIKVFCPNNGCGKYTTRSELNDHVRWCEVSTTSHSAGTVGRCRLPLGRRNLELAETPETSTKCDEPEQAQTDMSNLALGLGIAGGVLLIGGAAFIVVKAAPIAISVGATLFQLWKKKREFLG